MFITSLLNAREMDLEDLEIIVGTYEEFLLGYKVVPQENNEEYEFLHSFATHSHRASVRSVATGGKFLASGGTDESIFVYDMTTRKEAGLLMQHNGTISCLEFAPNGSHLLSGSEDGSIGACRTGNWQLEKLWGKAHKGSAVTSVSIHPSGKLFLSVGIDGTIRTWNFVKGRPAYTTHLCKLKDGRSITQVLWSPDGETYSVLIGTRVEVYNVGAASIIYTIQLDNKITCICYTDSITMCVAAEEGGIFLYNIDEKTLIGQFQAHEGRVRCLMSFKTEFIASASSAGQIKLWWIKDPTNVHKVCETTTGCRITCMALVNIKTNIEDTGLRPVKLVNTSPMKVESDAREVASMAKKRTKPLEIVTIEVENDEAKDGGDIAVKRKKKKQSKDGSKIRNHPTEPVTTRDKNEKHKKKKKKKQDVMMSLVFGESAASDTSKGHTEITRPTLNYGKIKKNKSPRMKQHPDKTPTSNNRIVKRKRKEQVWEEVDVVTDNHERKNKKSPTVKEIEAKTPASNGRSVRRKRKGQVWEEVEVGTDNQGAKKKKHSQDDRLEIFAKKSKKQNTVGKLHVFNSPSGKWIAE